MSVRMGIGPISSSEPYEDWVVRQMIPATGWLAEYTPDEGQPPILQRVACWVLVDNDKLEIPEQVITGLVADDDSTFLSPAATSTNFARFVHESEVAGVVPVEPAFKAAFGTGAGTGDSIDWGEAVQGERTTLHVDQVFGGEEPR